MGVRIPRSPPPSIQKTVLLAFCCPQDASFVPATTISELLGQEVAQKGTVLAHKKASRVRASTCGEPEKANLKVEPLTPVDAGQIEKNNRASYPILMRRGRWLIACA
ncbi:MAG TPA: hypothetical protein VFZ34_11010 [Blastocatellia bacterium]|nr:hypothetical protein [Blastocatellia bacterium]